MSKWVPLMALLIICMVALAALASDLSDWLDVDLSSLPLLRSGDRGEWVETLQQALDTLGYEPGPIDGIMGRRTESAVRELQRDHSLKVDGIVGQATWEAVTRSLLEMGSLPPDPDPDKRDRGEPQEALPPVDVDTDEVEGEARDSQPDDPAQSQDEMMDSEVDGGSEDAEDVETYVVRPGDTLFSIADRHGVSVSELAELNRLADPDHIEVGQAIRIFRAQEVSGDTDPPPESEPESEKDTEDPVGDPADARVWYEQGWFAYLPSLGQRDPDEQDESGPEAGHETVPIALTFNDGPDPAVTSRILEILAVENVQATFFVVGQDAASYPQLVRRMAQDGHQVENHSYTHPDFARDLSWRDMRTEIGQTAQLIQQLTGRKPRYFRPPFGSWDQAVATACAQEGHKIILWSNIAAQDQPFPGQDELVDRLARSAFPGAVIMLHADSMETAEALPAIISALKEEHYYFSTLDDLPGGPLPGLLYDAAE